jgi:3-phenylpropionate/trans-cinnamate dioxygenase ferredoxin reductase component
MTLDSGVTSFDILIVGAGHAGAQAAILLRQLGFEGKVGLVGAEAELPYERPPLSKEYLAGEKEFERMLIRPAPFWADRRIELVPDTKIVTVDAAARLVTSEAGESFGYASLIWATGGVPRRLRCEGRELAGVHLLRSHADVKAIKRELDRAARIVVVGGGYIGLETAAVLTRRGKAVVLVEALDRVLARVAAPELSRFYEAEHRARGVDIRLSETIAAIEGESPARAVLLASGERIEADLIIVGIGIAPAAEPLLNAGAESSDGVHVDELCRTSLPDIYAVGDCAAHVNRFGDGRRLRIESVQNAHDQASTAAKAILGQPEPYQAMPWFWSNQYDLRLQTVGLTAGYDSTVVRGRPEERSWSLIYLRRGHVIALDCVNATKDYVHGRKLILAGTAFDPDRLADVSVPLKEMI